MRSDGCSQEAALISALHASQWPHGCGGELRRHVARCESCTELLALAAALIEDERTLIQEASVPSSAVVWWRAQMRSRREAARRAAQPISVVQGIGAACAAGLLATAIGLFVPTFRSAFDWMIGVATAWAVLPVTTETLAGPVAAGFVAGAALCALLAPIVLYFTFRED